MSMFAPYLLYLKIAAFVILLSSLVWYHHHVDQGGYNRRGAEQLVIDAINKAKAETELALINSHVKEVQADLDKLTASLSTKQTELDHAKQISSDYQVRLASGADRLRVRTTTSCTDKTGDAKRASVANVDRGTEDLQDLAPSVAVGLERLRLNENTAIDRLDGCISSYNAVKAAADALK